MLEKEGRDAPTPSNNPVRPMTSTSLNILHFWSFKCYVLNPVSDLLGKTRLEHSIKNRRLVWGDRGENQEKKLKGKIWQIRIS